MNANHKEAANLSKSGQTHFVVYVPDQGEEVYCAEQMKTWGAFVMIEATYINGEKQ